MIRKQLDRDTTIYVANAIVVSRIDDCNYSVHTHEKAANSPKLSCMHCKQVLFCDLPVWSKIHLKLTLLLLRTSPSNNRPLFSQPLLYLSHYSDRTPTVFGTNAYANYTPKLWNVLFESVCCTGSVINTY